MPIRWHHPIEDKPPAPMTDERRQVRRQLRSGPTPAPQPAEPSPDDGVPPISAMTPERRGFAVYCTGRIPEDQSSPAPEGSE